MSGFGKMTLVAIMLLLVWVGPALGKGPQAVSKTIHNLSDDGTTWAAQGAFGYDTYSTNEDEVCIFCHTPHGGTLDGPLWNHSLPGAGSFTHYNSATISTVLQGLSVTRPVGAESLLCMACHDGSIATNRVLNPSNDLPDTGAGPGVPTKGGTSPSITDFGFARNFNRIGSGYSNWSGTGDLSDDHPISFSYTDILSGDAQAAAKLNALATATAAGVRFFGSTNRVECGSCHDPHVNYDTAVPPPVDLTARAEYAPFLITSNAGSKLCLACHNK